MVRSDTRRNDCQIAIIGAGPYGLAAAAHLQAANIRPLVFGEAMSFWQNHMPKGMLLRSPWRGNHIADPANQLTLDRFAAETNCPATDPMSVDTFVRYGRWVQNKVAPQLDTRKIVSISAAGSSFRLVLDDGESLQAGRVVIATGLARQEVRPSQFDELAPGRVSHTSEHTDLSRFRGKRVAVVGGGQNACEFAVLLHESGAEVELISRGSIDWTGAENPSLGGFHNSALRHLRPSSPIGPFPLNSLNSGACRLSPSP